MNGMARGVVPADHELAFSRARGQALRDADVAAGGRRADGLPARASAACSAPTPQLIVADRCRPEREHPRAGRRRAVRRPAGARLPRSPGPGSGRHEDWIAGLRAAETAARDAEAAELADDRTPLHPMRVYAELAPLLDRDAIVVIDGGDFGSYAGRVIDSYVPGAWLDSGPFGCLGSGPGYALAAKLARPDRQVVLLQGDGAFGFSRHGVGHVGAPRRCTVVSVIGNNGIWALEKHPDGGAVRLFGGRRAAAGHPLRRGGARRSAGTASWCPPRPSCGRRCERAFDSGLPAVVNVLTDPTVAYPRRSNLA